VHRKNPDFPLSETLKEKAEAGESWKISHLLREDSHQVAVVTIRRPKALNALNQDIIAEIREVFEAIKNDEGVKAAVITGFGKKAFVSGADIQMIASAKTPEEGMATSRFFQETLLAIENLGKPVVAALNGLAFGGGNELAMACSARIAKKGLKVLGAQPEVKLGIIPGAGATQRLPRLVGFPVAAELLRTGKTFSSQQALEWGLIREEVAGDLLERACQLALELAENPREAAGIDPKPLDSVESLQDLEIGNLSRKIDAILCKAITEGAKKNLKDALFYETELFGEVCQTRDMKIGLDNFIKTGLKEEARFVHA
jgi:enoyl-CoA hydratase/carnithine racemase